MADLGVLTLNDAAILMFSVWQLVRSYIDDFTLFVNLFHHNFLKENHYFVNVSCSPLPVFL